MEKKPRLKPDFGIETFVFMAFFALCFGVIGSRMGGTRMVQTLMNSSHRLLIDVCFYIMAIAVLAGAMAGVFSEFGVIALINRLLSRIMMPIYGLPGATSLGILNCYLSDNPSILPLAYEDNFRQYFKTYQLPALTNLGTSFGMGLIVTTAMMGLPVAGAVKGALLGNLGAVVGSVVSVWLMLHFTKAVYGTDETVRTKYTDSVPKNMRTIRDGTPGGRMIQSLLDGGRLGIDVGMAIIPGVLVICSLVLLLTNGPGPDGVYTGAANEGVRFLPWLGDKLSFVLRPLFGFSSAKAIAVPITALGSAGAALGVVSTMAVEGLVTGNDVAVFTAICMCWSGYLSTHIAMMSALGVPNLTGKAIFSHTVGGLCAGVAAHFFYMILC